MSKTEATIEIENRIVKWGYLRNFVKIKEFRFGVIGSHIADVFAISTNSGNETVTCEIKTSRADFLKDLKQTRKQCEARLFSNRFYYCAPKGLIKKEEIPDFAGFVEFDLEQPMSSYDVYGLEWNVYATLVIDAPILEREIPTWGMIISAARRDFVDTHDNLKRLIIKERNILPTKTKLDNIDCLFDEDKKE